MCWKFNHYVLPNPNFSHHIPEQKSKKHSQVNTGIESKIQAIQAGCSILKANLYVAQVAFCSVASLHSTIHWHLAAITATRPFRTTTFVKMLDKMPLAQHIKLIANSCNQIKSLELRFGCLYLIELCFSIFALVLISLTAHLSLNPYIRA